MSIKACFFDLDGTLLNHESHISDRTRQCLMECKEKGIQCYIATGRTKNLDKMLPGWTKETFDLFDGGVFCNGACTWIEDAVEYSLIDVDAVKTCVDIVNSYSDIHFVLQMKDEVHCFNYEFNEEHIDQWGLQERRIVPLTDFCLKQTVKMMIYTKNLVDRTEQLPVALYDELKRKMQEDTNLYLTDHGEVIMVMPKGISKYSGIEKIRKSLQLSTEEIVVFGDDNNDVEMLRAYPNSVAMGNGVPEVKEISSYTTLRNDEDGVVYALKNILKVI